MHSTIFVEMCSPGPSSRPISNPNAETREPKESIIRNEMMFAPIKGKVLTDFVDESFKKGIITTFGRNKMSSTKIYC